MRKIIFILSCLIILFFSCGKRECHSGYDSLKRLEGEVFPASVKVSVTWQRPDGVSGTEFMYSAIDNFRRNPFKYGLKEYEYVAFTRHRIIEKELAQRLKNKLVFGGNYSHQEFYSAPIKNL